LANYRHALTLARDGRAEAVCFTPFNKKAMCLAHPAYDDEISFSAGVVGLDGPASEFNVLGGLWNARVTSHISLAEVAARITTEAVLRTLRLTDSSMCGAGFERPRIAVAGLNPHASDGGNFGREEIDAIEPAVEQARADGIATEGPFPADTVFLRAKSGALGAEIAMRPRRAMPNRNDKILPDKNCGFAIGDVIVLKMGGARHHKQLVAINVDLR
jgi:4-hydroxythreonine-4-phosphate dehydrogenase